MGESRACCLWQNKSTYKGANGWPVGTSLVFPNIHANYENNLCSSCHHYLQSPEKQTFPLMIPAIGAANNPDYGLMMLAIVIAILPTMAVFFSLQKYFCGWDVGIGEVGELISMDDHGRK